MNKPCQMQMKIMTIMIKRSDGIGATLHLSFEKCSVDDCMFVCTPISQHENQISIAEIFRVTNIAPMDFGNSNVGLASRM